MINNKYFIHPDSSTPEDLKFRVAAIEEVLNLSGIHILQQEESSCIEQFMRKCLLKRIEEGHTSRIAVLGGHRPSLNLLIKEAFVFLQELMVTDQSFTIKMKIGSEWRSVEKVRVEEISIRIDSFMFKVHRADAFRDSIQEFIVLDFSRPDTGFIGTEFAKSDFSLIALRDLIPAYFRLELDTIKDCFNLAKTSSFSVVVTEPLANQSLKKSNSKLGFVKKMPRTKSPKSGVLGTRMFRSNSPATKITPTLNDLQSKDHLLNNRRTLENLIIRYNSPARVEKPEESSVAARKEESLNYSPKSLSNGSPFAATPPMRAAVNEGRTKAFAHPVVARLLKRDSPTNQQKKDPNQAALGFGRSGKSPALVSSLPINQEERSPAEKMLHKLDKKDLLQEDYKLMNEKMRAEIVELRKEFHSVVGELKKPQATALSAVKSLTRLKKSPPRTNFTTPNSAWASNNPANLFKSKRKLLLDELRSPDRPTPSQKTPKRHQSHVEFEFKHPTFKQALDNTNEELANLHQLRQNLKDLSPLRPISPEPAQKKPKIDPNIEKVEVCNS